MVQLDAIRAANSELVNRQPLVAVFVGGTTGIGEYTLREFVKTHSAKGKGLFIYIVGRNIQSAEKIIADCKTISPDAEYFFIQAKDLSLLQDNDETALKIDEHQRQHASLSSNPRIDLLFMTQGGFYPGPRNETKEGLHYGMSMHYYSRARLAYQLLPLLRSSTLPARVVSVYAAGMEDKLFTDDLSLRKPDHHGFANARSHCVFMTTLFFEQLASENPVSFINTFPGLIITPGFWSPEHPWWFRVIWRIVSPLVKLFATPADDGGQRMLFLATDKFPASGAAAANTGGEIAVGTDGTPGSGAYACNNDGEVTPQTKRDKAFQAVPMQRDDLSKLVWEHTMKAFDAAAAGERFSE